MQKRTQVLFFDQRRHFWCLVNDRKAFRLTDLGSSGSPRRFSSGLRGACRSAQLWQQFVHPATYLLWGGGSVRALPRVQLSFHEVACQNQVIEDNGDNLAPAFKLLWSAQARLGPQQGLLLEAISMFLAKATDVAQGDFHQISLLIANPDKPAHPRISFSVAGMRTHDAHDADLQPACFFQVQLLPPGDLDCSPLLILAPSHSRGLFIAGGILGLQLVSIFARCSWLAR